MLHRSLLAWLKPGSGSTRRGLPGWPVVRGPRPQSPTQEEKGMTDSKMCSTYSGPSEPRH